MISPEIQTCNQISAYVWYFSIQLKCQIWLKSEFKLKSNYNQNHETSLEILNSCVNGDV